MKAHLLRDSKGTLQDQLVEKDDHISKISAKYHQTASELQALKETVRKQDTQIKSQTRDFTHLQVSAVVQYSEFKHIHVPGANLFLRQNYNPSNPSPKTLPSS